MVDAKESKTEGKEQAGKSLFCGGILGERGEEMEV
jgi:hypothetical protein